MAPLACWILFKKARIHGGIRVAQVFQEAAELTRDFSCFSETRTAEGDFLLDGGPRFLCSHGRSNCSGVAVLAHARWPGQIVSYRDVSDRISFVVIQRRESLVETTQLTWHMLGIRLQNIHIVFELRNVLLEVYARGSVCVAGIDFNSDRQKAWRADCLTEFVKEVPPQSKL